MAFQSEDDAMLYDPAFSSPTLATCRRSGDRLPYPAELILIWNHDPATRIRYRVLDAGDGGCRIHTSLPLIEGMTGMALKLLPEGNAINRPIMVVWNGRSQDDDGHEAGLRFF